MAYLDVVRTVFQNNLIQDGNILKGEAGCKDIEIGGDVVLFKSGDNIIRDTVLGNIFKDFKGYKRNADWVIFSEGLILICEMKTVAEREFVSQLKSSKAFIDFLLEKIWIHNNFEQRRKPRVRFVLFSTTGRKQNSTNKLDADNYGDGVHLYRLACNSFYSIKQFN